MKSYLPTIGLEIHAELNTASKMFCACRNDPDEVRPNVNVCAVCMAHPGTLPVINREAVRKVLKVGVALGGRLADKTIFDRKNYFYPDIPKGYQISQYEHPLVSGGSLAGIAITRVHLEEDTARSSHEEGASLVDFNRSSVPLMELVTEPVIRTAADAGRFARELQLLLRYLGVAEANMEKGEMRVEANVSVSDTEGVFGTKVEVKNLNSFRSVERAIEHETERQIRVLREGGTIVQETRGWDENAQTTFSQRKKESSHDYRYLPEPDLPPLRISAIHDFSGEVLRAEQPELPEVRRNRYTNLGLKEDDASMFVRSPIFGDFFEWVLKEDAAIAVLASNYIASDIAGKVEDGTISHDWMHDVVNAGRFARLMALVKKGTLSSRGAKDALSAMIGSSEEPEELARSLGLVQENNEELIVGIAHAVVEQNPDVVAEYRAGKASAIQFLIGQGMKQSKGAANPALLRSAFETLLG